MPSGRREEQAVVLWTDGEDLEHGADAAIAELERADIRVFAVGVGTPDGEIVPVLDDQGRAVDVKRDENGGPVRSRLDETLLRSIANRTHGGYFSAGRPGGELPRLLAAVSSLAESGRGQRLVERPVSRFPWLALLAALLLAVDRGRDRRRPERFATPAPAPRSAARGAVAAAAVLVVWLGVPGRAAAESAWARGDRAFRAGRWAEAESLYARRLSSGRARGAEVNLATVRARAGKQEDAERGLARLAGDDDAAGRVAGYNLGTLLAERQSYDDALRELRRAIERDPGDGDARWNYEVALRRKHDAEHRSQRPPTPKSSGGGAPQPKPTGGVPQSNPAPPGAGSSLPPPSGPAPPLSSGSGGGAMDRKEADRILGALEEQARMQQGQHRVRVLSEKRGRDW
jgi:Ca-activated chloride channel family protein